MMKKFFLLSVFVLGQLMLANFAFAVGEGEACGGDGLSCDSPLSCIAGKCQNVYTIQDTGSPFHLQVQIPGLNNIGYPDTGGSALRNYVIGVYKFAIGVVGILATIMIAFGGIIWITSGGNASQIGKAQQMIWGSTLGLILAMFSYVILYTINPEIVKLNFMGVESVSKVKKGCSWQIKACDPIEQVNGKRNDCGDKPSDGKSKFCCCINEDISVQGCCSYELNGVKQAADMSKAFCENNLNYTNQSFYKNKIASGNKCIEKREVSCCECGTWFFEDFCADSLDHSELTDESNCEKYCRDLHSVTNRSGKSKFFPKGYKCNPYSNKCTQL